MGPPPTDSFFTVNLGNLLTIVSILLVLAGMHKSNIKRIEDTKADYSEMKTKLDTIYRWFERNVIDKHDSRNNN